MNRELLMEQLSQLPLYTAVFIDPKSLEFSQRVRHICKVECPMYGSTWACPPGVGPVEKCQDRCYRYAHCLMIGSITEVADIADIQETLDTRGDHEELTNQVLELMRSHGLDPYVLSTEACQICPRCAFLDGEPCRFPERMHPAIESHGINLIPTLEAQGLEFQYGGNIVTWYSLLFFNE